MDNTYTHSVSSAKKALPVELKSFAFGFLVASAFFLVPMSMGQAIQGSVVTQDIDRDGIPDSVDASFRHPLAVVVVEEEICEPTDVDEDGVIDENEGCPVDEEVADDEGVDEVDSTVEVEDTDEVTEEATEEVEEGAL